MNFEHKKVLVVGMARSGVAAAQLLRASGEEELGQQLKPLEGLQVERRFGCGAMDLLEGKDCLVISPGIPDTVPFVVKAKEMGILSEGGGHSMAAGFTLTKDKIPEFKKFCKHCGKVTVHKISK